MEVIEAEALLGPTCATLQVCHRYVNACSRTFSSLTLILIWYGFLSCLMIIDPELSLDLILTWICWLHSLSVKPLLCSYIFTFGSQLTFLHRATWICCSFTSSCVQHISNCQIYLAVGSRHFSCITSETLLFPLLSYHKPLSSPLKCTEECQNHIPSLIYGYIYLANEDLSFPEIPSLSLCPCVKVNFSFGVVSPKSGVVLKWLP